MTGFHLHERLGADTVEVTRWPLSLVLLMNARQWPWLILVPRHRAVEEIHQLPAADRILLIDEIARASQALATVARPDKINVGALGNLVPQLHVHVVARYRTDPAWPKPVWGALPPEPYAESELADWLRRLRAACD